MHSPAIRHPSPLDIGFPHDAHAALSDYRKINGRNPKGIIDPEGVEATSILPEGSSVEGDFRDAGISYSKISLSEKAAPGQEQLRNLFASYIDNRTTGYDRAYGWPAIDGQLGSDPAENMVHMVITRPATEEEKGAGEHVCGDRFVIAGMRFAIYDPDPKKYPAIANNDIKNLLLEASSNGEMRLS